ncbi:hypothetical protein CEXT_155931 [Caerostris extrusa]|uniref:Uncharacterized protein n=1 Tax=Caerostris extrusa TaxID=172846 RepID=A0AAV4QFE1_CAEEX|nr:hypothetical protein CEXT_155931 [Caerostris extrusa]
MYLQNWGLQQQNVPHFIYSPTCKVLLVFSSGIAPEFPNAPPFSSNLFHGTTRNEDYFSPASYHFVFPDGNTPIRQILRGWCHRNGSSVPASLFLRTKVAINWRGGKGSRRHRPSPVTDSIQSIGFVHFKGLICFNRAFYEPF